MDSHRPGVTNFVHIGLVVEDLDETVRFLELLGFDCGEPGVFGGQWIDRIIGLESVTVGVSCRKDRVIQPAARPTSLFSGTNAVVENIAPCGSRSTVKREYGASTGATSTVPPSSAAFAAVASASSVEKVTLQWAGVSASSPAIGVIAASTSSNPAAPSCAVL